MGETLNLYAGQSALTSPAGAIGLLCEFAADTAWLRKVEQVHTADEMMGPPDTALSIAYPIVSKLLSCSPEIEGLKILSIFEESLLEQASYILQALHLDEWITSHGFAAAKFVSHSPWLDRLRLIQSSTGTRYELLCKLPFAQLEALGRIVRRARALRPSSSEIFQRVAPNRSRCMAGAKERKAASQVQRGGIWFYSTSYNFTKIGMAYEPYIPGKLNFLVEDDETGGRRLRELGRERHSLYAWTRNTDLPTTAEVRAARARITEAAAAAPLSGEEGTVRSVLLKSEWWSYFLSRQVAFAMYNSRALERWREAVQPEMLVVGNASWERALLLRGGMKTVPSLMLQHGVMHWVYGVADQPVDVFLVRGPFFQRVMNDRLRQKSLVRNFDEPSPPVESGGERSDLLFITTPYDILPFFHHEDLKDILRSLLRVAHAHKRRLVVRVHPQEKIVQYKDLARQLQAELGIVADVSFSQGAGVEEILAQSCVAVLYFSTMFLDCLRHRIPIISFGWHWFPNKRQFEEEAIFNFASNLAHLESLLQKSLAGELAPKQGGLEEFLAPCRAAEVTSVFQKMLEKRVLA